MRETLSMPGMLKQVRAVFNKISAKVSERSGHLKKRVANNKIISLTDHLMAGLAVFHLKFPSLLKYVSGIIDSSSTFESFS